MVCKFQLENGNSKNFFKKHMKVAKKSLFFFSIAYDNRAHFSRSFGLKLSSGLRKKATAHCSKGGAKVKINVFKFGSNIHSSIPNEELH